MHFKSSLLGLICLSAAAGVTASECKKTGTMTGWVQTVNVSETLQYGLTEITVEREGKPYFSQTGVIIGQQTSPTTLNHTVYFADGTKLETFGDQVISFIPTSECSFEVKELITSVWADKKLNRLSNDQHDVLAIGTVSFCPGDNENYFDLDGTVCFG